MAGSFFCGSDRGHDAFVYMPAAHGVRRVSTAQRGDSLFGTDVTYEDLERRRVEDFRVVAVDPDIAQEEAVIAIFAEPRTARSFHTVRFDVARADGVLLQTAYFKRGAQAPFREITAARGGMRRQGGHTLPTRLLVENHDRGTTTNVFYRGLEIAATIDDRLFSVRTLEQKGRIPGAPHAPERPTDPSSR